MTNPSTPKIVIVIPNWNGMDTLGDSSQSLLGQTQAADIVVVENGSTDGSQALLTKNYPKVFVIQHSQNLGFAGGVNAGIRHAIANNYDYVALFNNDATAEPDWLSELAKGMTDNTGITTGSFTALDKSHYDSTGDLYTTWGLPFPRGRGESVSNQYANQPAVFGASGGASLYRVEMFKRIGLFDEDFFAYYEDVDISFRAQLAGWKVKYVPEAVAYHHIGATCSKIKGFTTYQTIKNLPWVIIKNVPLRLLPMIVPRFLLAHSLFIASAFQRGHGWYALKGIGKAVLLTPKKLIERFKIQKNRQVSVEYLQSLLTYDLPPNANKIRTLRAKWWKLKGKTT